MELAKAHHQTVDVDSLMAQYATHLLKDDKILSAIELYPAIIIISPF